MMQGSLASVSNREDWIVQSPLIDDDGAEVDLTTASISVFVCDEGCPSRARLTGTIDDGAITLPTATSFQWWFDPDDMGALCPGTYEVYLRVTIDGITTQILACSIAVVQGGPA
jgi:hypothetical protein